MALATQEKANEVLITALYVVLLTIVISFISFRMIRVQKISFKDLLIIIMAAIVIIIMGFINFSEYQKYFNSYPGISDFKMATINSLGFIGSVIKS